MIINIECQCIIEGKAFDPNVLSFPDEIRVIKKYKKGDKNKFGLNRGKIIGEGLLIIGGPLDEILKFVELFFISDSNILKMNLAIVVKYYGDCNFELTNEQLLRVSNLKIPLGISCYNND